MTNNAPQRVITKQRPNHETYPCQIVFKTFNPSLAMQFLVMSVHITDSCTGENDTSVISSFRFYSFFIVVLFLQTSKLKFLQKIIIIVLINTEIKIVEKTNNKRLNSY